jgi:hypothetical protein
MDQVGHVVRKCAPTAVSQSIDSGDNNNDADNDASGSWIIGYCCFFFRSISLPSSPSHHPIRLLWS